MSLLDRPFIPTVGKAERAFLARHDIEHQAAMEKTTKRSAGTGVVIKANVSQSITEGGVIGVTGRNDHVYIVCGPNRSRALIGHDEVKCRSSYEDDLRQQMLQLPGRLLQQGQVARCLVPAFDGLG